MSRLSSFRVACPRGCRAAALLLLAAALGGCAERVARPIGLPQGAIAPPATTAPLSITPNAALPASPADGKSRVALLLPLSGPSGGIGRALLDAAQMAVFEVGDNSLLLLPRDTGGTPEGAVRAADDALKQGAQLILGPLLAGEVEAVKPLARAANVNLVAFSTSTQLAGDGTFLLSFQPRQAVERVAAFAYAQGAERFAALAPMTPYGELVAAELRTAAAKLGAAMGPVEFYDPAATDLRPVVRRLASFDDRSAALQRERKQLEAAGDEASQAALRRLAAQTSAGELAFDAVMLPDGGAKLKAVASLLPYFDVEPGKVHVLGTGLWDDPGLGSEPALVGGWFAAPSPEARHDFETRFQQLYKRRPPRLATLGYDATALAAILAHGNGGGPFPASALADPSGFAGVDGIFRFRPDGLVERGLAVLEIQRDGVKVVSPAPESFEQPAS